MKLFQGNVIDWFFKAILMLISIAILFCIIFSLAYEHLREDYIFTATGLFSVLLTIAVSLLINFLMKLLRYRYSDYGKLNDLIRGTIITSLEELKEAYTHFKKMPHVEIIDINEQLETHENVIVNFVFKKCIIGEM